jgi:uncharacterized membrane protein YoaK (UPF0700 family)
MGDGAPQRPAHSSGLRQSAWRDYVSHPVDGPLPAILLVLTVMVGVVDAASILDLGRVFVANMTGNVVFIGFAIAGAPGFALDASLVALAGFLVGAWLGGLVVRRTRSRAILLSVSTCVGVGLLTAATALAPAAAHVVVRDLIVGFMAIALGVQNSAVRRLAVADLTTTVLTMTLTGIAADLRGGRPRVVVRRVLSVLAMLMGATIGALLSLNVSLVAALAVALGLAVIAAIASLRAARRPASWQFSGVPG